MKILFLVGSFTNAELVYLPASDSAVYHPNVSGYFLRTLSCFICPNIHVDIHKHIYMHSIFSFLEKYSESFSSFGALFCVTDWTRTWWFLYIFFDENETRAPTATTQFKKPYIEIQRTIILWATEQRMVKVHTRTWAKRVKWIYDRRNEKKNTFLGEEKKTWTEKKH